MNTFLGAGLSRRQLLKSAACGVGYLALADLFSRVARASQSASPLAAKSPHFTARAKRVIFLFMQGAPSHVDTFDYKPQLAVDNGKSVDANRGRKLLKSPFEFAQHGKSGLWLPEIFPNLAKHADELCLLNSMYTDTAVHPQASIQMHTGNFRFPRPSMGAWTVYGLGTENTELPGFLAIDPAGGAETYGSSFLPASYQATRIDGVGGGKNRKTAVANIENPKVSTELQRKQLDLIAGLNRDRLERDKVNPGLEGIIESYELAFRMEGAVPEIMDLASESPSTLAAYGVGDRATDRFGRQCLLARRFAEQGVRFIELGMGGWDQHNNLRAKLASNATAIDKPIAALLADLKQRDMLKDTLVVWGGEFGRTPSAQNNDGRDHNNKGFSMWMAGGGVKGGLRYGKTDEHGVAAVENKMHINDLHATMLYLLGLDHTKLTYPYSGREIRLTDLAGKVVQDIVA